MPWVNVIATGLTLGVNGLFAPTTKVTVIFLFAAGAFTSGTLYVVVPAASAAHEVALGVKVTVIGVPLATPPADATLSQLAVGLVVPKVKGVPPVAAEVTLMVALVGLTLVWVLLQVNVTALGEGTSAEPLLVVMVTVTGIVRFVPATPTVVAGANVSAGLAGSVPVQPAAIVMVNAVALVVELTDNPVLV